MLVIIMEDALCGAVHVLILPGVQAPQECAKSERAEAQCNGYEKSQKGHALFCRHDTAACKGMIVLFNVGVPQHGLPRVTVQAHRVEDDGDGRS